MKRLVTLFLALFFASVFAQACNSVGESDEIAPIVPTPDPVATLIVYPEHATIFGIDSSESAARYRVDEGFFERVSFGEASRESWGMQNIGNTPSLNGVLALDLNVDPPQVIGGHFIADLNLLQINQLPENGLLHADWLANPKATFILEPQTILQGSYSSGDQVVFPLTGSMTVRDVTIPVTFTATATYDETTGIIQATANARLLISDFGAEPPDMVSLAEADDGFEIGAVIVARLLE